MRVVIIGNSGSGKTWLAAKMAKKDGLPVTHLDDLFWEPGGFDNKRPKETVLRLVEESRASHSWIVEGVFGELAKLYIDQADLLVWLDIDWDICRKRLLERGSESKKHMAREQSEEGLRKLVEWASRYYDRSGLCSHAGHRDLFERFCGRKIHARSVTQIDAI
jgi:adenylate kinase family enzyme